MGRGKLFFSSSSFFLKQKQKQKKEDSLSSQPNKMIIIKKKFLIKLQNLLLLSFSFFRISNRKTERLAWGGGEAVPPRGGWNPSPAYFDKRANLITCINVICIRMQPASPKVFFFFFLFFCFVRARPTNKGWYVCTTKVRRTYICIIISRSVIILYAAEIGFVKKELNFFLKKKVPQAPVYLNDLRLRERESGR